MRKELKHNLSNNVSSSVHFLYPVCGCYRYCNNRSSLLSLTSDLSGSMLVCSKRRQISGGHFGRCTYEVKSGWLPLGQVVALFPVEAEALKLNSSSFHTVTVLFSAVLFQLLTSGGSSRHMTFQPRLDGSMPPPASQTLRCPTHLVFCRIEI